MATILAVLGRLWVPLGTLLGTPRRPWGALGRPRDASEAFLGGFLALLRRTWDHPVAPNPSRDRFGRDFGWTWGSIWIGLVTKLGEFGR